MHSRKIRKNVLERDDNLIMAIAGLTTVEESYFTIESDEAESRGYIRGERVSIVYSVNLNLNKISRRVLTLSESLGNVGGLNEVLSITASAIQFLLFRYSADDLLVWHLYKAKSRPTPYGMYLLKCLCIFRANRARQEKYAKGRKLLESEKDLVSVVRTLRLHGLALRELIQAP